MRGQVPQTNSEIAAWNWGNARGLAGLPSAPDPELPPAHDLDSVGGDILEAFSAIGEDRFSYWVTQGWLAAMSGIS